VLDLLTELDAGNNFEPRLVVCGGVEYKRAQKVFVPFYLNAGVGDVAGIKKHIKSRNIHHENTYTK
jgi:hypothetical protein